ncbi:NAD-dependent epimerase/dehydratase family protein [Nibricoccus sp. IMCC34717]|uniref:NAD-dependent epimerase/dehydratase family protein n=1 Tax=Nibricoccus sp. IMCC34717 TaxID=3034021 RepID=UPI00384D797A
MEPPAETTKKRANTVVIFGCGYVGAVVAQWELAQGRRVIALTRNAAKAAELRAGGVEVIEANLEDEAWHAAINPRGADIVNTVSGGGRGIAGYAISYVRGFESIRKWARARGPAAQCVYTSSTSVYGADAGTQVDESAPTHPASAASEFLCHAEQLLAQGTPTCWERAFVLRLAGLYGPGRHLLLDQVRQSPAPVSGLGDNTLNLIHRDDAAAAIIACLHARDGAPVRTYNVADDGRAKRSEIVGWLAGKLGVPTPAFSGEPAEGRRRLTPNRIILNDALKRDLGWRMKYATFREGYGELV